MKHTEKDEAMTRMLAILFMSTGTAFFIGLLATVVSHELGHPMHNATLLLLVTVVAFVVAGFLRRIK